MIGDTTVVRGVLPRSHVHGAWASRHEADRCEITVSHQSAVYVQASRPAHTGERERDTESSTWHLRAIQQEPSLVFDPCRLEPPGLQLQIGQGWQLYPHNGEAPTTEGVIDHVLDTADLRAFFAGVAALRAQLRAVGFDV